MVAQEQIEQPQRREKNAKTQTDSYQDDEHKSRTRIGWRSQRRWSPPENRPDTPPHAAPTVTGIKMTRECVSLLRSLQFQRHGSRFDEALLTVVLPTQSAVAATTAVTATATKTVRWGRWTVGSPKNIFNPNPKL